MSSVNFIMTSHLRARDQHHLEDVLGARGRVSHHNVEGPVDAEGHLPHVTLRLLPVAVVRHVNVREHTMKVETCLLTCNKNNRTIMLFLSCMHLKYRGDFTWGLTLNMLKILYSNIKKKKKHIFQR